MAVPEPNNFQADASPYREGGLRGALASVRRFHRKYGVLRTMRRAFVVVFRLDPYKRQVDRHASLGNEAVFSTIYKHNLWVDGESRSGPGSTLTYTKTLREALPRLLSDLRVQKFIDAPCGDFNWMRQVELPPGCTYVGVDVVPEMIAANQLQFASERRSFVKLDITRDPLPRGDMVFCRDCLLHLSIADIFRFLHNFVESGSTYLMTTTHRNDGEFANRDIVSGYVRLIDLFAEPFCLSRDVVARIDDYIAPHPPREMVVWRREAIVAALARRSKPG